MKAWAAWLPLMVVVAILVPVTTPAAVSISPAYVDVNLSEGRGSGSFRIANLGDEEERYRLNAVHFNLTKDGSLHMVPPDDHSSAAWIKFNPKEFTLPPKTQRIVRFAIVPPADPIPGEYWAGIELESLEATKSRFDDGEGHRMTINTVTSILVPVFARIGNVHNSGALRSFELTELDDGPTLEAVIANTGDGRLVVKGTYTIIDGAGKVVHSGEVGHGYVLRARERRYRVPITTPLPVGDYTVRVSFESPQLERELEGERAILWQAANGPAD